jgi:hypothetical protein
VKASSLITAAHPHQEFSGIIQLGLKASTLAVLHQTVLEPRLPPGTLTTLIEDLSLLGAIVPGARQVRQEAKVATAAQAAALRAGHARVKAVRAAVRKARTSKEVQKAYGVGQVVNVALVRDVKSVLKQILDRASANPDEAASFGIVKKDLEAITAAHQAITDADKTQDHKQATAPLSTQDRNRTANRILGAVARIAGAGGLEFAEDPDVLAAFTALKPASRKKNLALKAARAPKQKVAAKETATPAPAIDDPDLAPDTLAEPLKQAS